MFGSHGVFFLPYLTGERFPIMDSHIRASFLGLSRIPLPQTWLEAY